jgi:hypothetical protein
MATENTEKLRELIVYIAHRCRDEEDFAAAHLLKALFLADFARYQRTRSSITDRDYVRLDSGPAPEGFDEALVALQRHGAISIETRIVESQPSSRVVAQRAPKADLFTLDELRLVHEAIDRVRGADAGNDDGVGREFIGWQEVAPGERLPYGMAWLYKPALTGEQIARIAEEVERVGHKQHA